LTLPSTGFVGWDRDAFGRGLPDCGQGSGRMGRGRIALWIHGGLRDKVRTMDAAASGS